MSCWQGVCDQYVVLSVLAYCCAVVRMFRWLLKLCIMVAREL